MDKDNQIIWDIISWINNFYDGLDYSKHLNKFINDEYCFRTYKDKIDINNYFFNDVIDKYCLMICNINCDIFYKEILNSNKEIVINSSNIPQYSNIFDGTINLLDILIRSGNYGLTFDEVGEYLTYKGKKKGAYKKYGENHSKLAQLLDLVYIEKKEGKFKVYLTLLGKGMHRLSKYNQQILISKLSLKIPIVRMIIKEATYKEVSIDEFMNMLSQSTITRRKPNIKLLLNNIYELYSDQEIYHIFKNIK